MKKLITASILAVCSLAYAGGSSLEDDMNEFIKLYNYMECFYGEMDDRERKNGVGWKCTGEFHSAVLDQYTVVSKMGEALVEYVKEHYKNLSLDMLKSFFLDEDSKYGKIGCAEGLKDAMDSPIKDFSAYSKAYNRLVEIKNKYPEMFEEKNSDQKCNPVLKEKTAPAPQELF